MKLLIFSLLFLTSCMSTRASLTPITLESGTHIIPLRVEIADDPSEQAEGLMGRTELPEGQGMLFVFRKPQKLSFWMKNTKIPLDIFFFDADGRFLGWRAMEPCQKEPCPLYLSDAPATYALEVSAGFFAAQQMQRLQDSREGLRLRFAEGRSSP